MTATRRFLSLAVVGFLVGCQAVRPVAPWQTQRVSPWPNGPTTSAKPVWPTRPPAKVPNVQSSPARNDPRSNSVAKPVEKLVPTPLPDPQSKASETIPEDVTIRAAKPAVPDADFQSVDPPSIRFKPAPPQDIPDSENIGLPSLSEPANEARRKGDSQPIQSTGLRLGFEALPPPGDSQIVLNVKSPSRAPVGGTVTFDIEVRNDTNDSVTDAVVKVDFDDAFLFPGHNETRLTKRFGTLEAGQSRPMRLTLASYKPGTHSCRFELAAKGHSKIQHEVVVEFREQKLDVKLIGPARRTIGSRAEFVVKIANVWTEPLTDVALSLSHDATLKLHEATGGYQQDSNMLKWKLDRLPPGAGMLLLAEFDCRQASEQACLTAIVSSAEVSDEVVESCLAVAGASDMVDLKISDRTEPIQVGGVVEYEIVAQNIGLQSLPSLVLNVSGSEHLRLESHDAWLNGQAVTLLKSEQDGQWTLAVNRPIPADAVLRLTIRAKTLRYGDAELLVTAASDGESTFAEAAEFTSINE